MVCGMVELGYKHAGGASDFSRQADSSVCACLHYAQAGWDFDGMFVKSASKVCYDLGAWLYNEAEYQSAVLPLSRACAIAENRCGWDKLYIYLHPLLQLQKSVEVGAYDDI
jgi:hypothetical protein